MDENVGSRAEFLARLQLFMDMTLEDLRKASGSKDVEEKDAQAIRGVALKLMRIWEKASANSLAGGRNVPVPGQAARKSPDSGKE